MMKRMFVRRSGSAARSEDVSEGMIEPANPNCAARFSASRRDKEGIRALYPSGALQHTADAPLTARIARNIGISLLARFSAAARGPLVLFLWLVHSSIASVNKPA